MSTDQPSKSASPAFLLDPILPTRSVNLLGGRSGSGKTTLLLQLLEDWSAGREVLGATSYPAPWCYVACAKPCEGILQTASRIGCTLDLAPRLISLTRDRLQPGEELTPEYALRAARVAVPSLRLLILDGIGRLCAAKGRVTEYNIVSEFMANLIRLAIREDLCVLGIGPVAKASGTTKSSRELFLGSVAWAEYAETIILVEEDDPSAPQSPRTVTIRPTNSPMLVIQHEIDFAGRLIPIEQDTSVEEMMLDIKLSAMQLGDIFTAADARAWAKEGSVSVSTARRWLTRMVKGGILEQPKHGTYRLVKRTIKE